MVPSLSLNWLFSGNPRANQGSTQQGKRKHLLGAEESHIFSSSVIYSFQQVVPELSVSEAGCQYSSRTKVQFPEGTFLFIFHFLFVSGLGFLLDLPSCALS